MASGSDQNVLDLFDSDSDGEDFHGFSDVEVDVVGPSSDSGSDTCEESLSDSGSSDDDDEQPLLNGADFADWFERSKWSKEVTPFQLPDFVEQTGNTFGLRNEEDAQAIDFFSLFFCDNLLNVIVSESEKYARQKNDESFVTSLEEIKAFIGVHVIMGFHRLPCIDDYWSCDSILGVDKIKETFSRNRFQTLLKHFHVSDSTHEPARTDPAYDKLYKVRHFIDVLSDRFLSLYGPKQELSIDEGMIGFKGRISIKQYMPAKPTKHGIKVWLIAEACTGYVSEFDVYLGKSSGTTNENGLGHGVVMKLARPFLNQNRHLYFDNYFNSPKLQLELLKVGTFACGTQRDDRKGFPPSLKGKRKTMKKSELFVLQKGSMVATCWKDKRVVAMLTTLDTNPSKERTVPVDASLPKPSAIKLYNQFMGGVDRGDQLRSYYPVGRKSRKWWRYIFWFLVNVTIVNANILMSASQSKKKYRHQIGFRKALCVQLIGGFCRENYKKRRSACTVDKQFQRSNLAGHRSVKATGRKRYCVNCKKNGNRTASGRSVETIYSCSHCQIHLCREVCFGQYHDQLTA